MSVKDAEPGDIYVDRSGKLWRVVGIIAEPSLTVQEIEVQTPGHPVRQTGGLTGLMWDGFKRIHRHEGKTLTMRREMATNFRSI